MTVKIEQGHTASFPKFCVFRAYPTPQLWTHDTAEDTARHLQGADLRYYAIFRDGKVIATPQSSELSKIKDQLNRLDDR